jgi:hypothetical protein
MRDMASESEFQSMPKIDDGLCLTRMDSDKKSQPTHAVGFHPIALAGRLGDAAGYEK